VQGSTQGEAACGVYGIDQSTGGGFAVIGSSDNGIGVTGTTRGDEEFGVYAIDESSGGGYGLVAGSYTGTGVYASGPVALQVEGVAAFSRSGIATVAGTSGKTAQSVKVTGVALTAASMILATPQAKVAGVGVEAAVPDAAAGSFTIYLTKAVKVSLPVAWFIVDQPASAGPRHPAPRRPPQRPR
jgi:hypothetical protein